MTIAADNFAMDGPMPEDGALLRRYVGGNDQAAFEKLVRRHVDWIYAAALRMTRDNGLAQDVTQGVLMALSRKAGALVERGGAGGREALGGWLFEATRHAARALLRAERRRKERERVYGQTKSMTCEGATGAAELNAQLDAAVAKLSAADRQAIVLRFYQRLAHAEVAAALGTTEESARKRVARALVRLRMLLGVAGTGEGLGAALAAMPLVLAPPHITIGLLAGKVTANASLVAKGVTVMRITAKIKMALAACVVAGVGGYFAEAYLMAQHAPVTVPVETALAAAGGNGAAAGGGSSVTVSGGGSGFSGGGGGGGGGTGAGNVSFNTWSDGKTTVRHATDDQYDITLTTTGDGARAVVKDSAGKVVFDGPFTTDDDKAKAPADIAGRISDMANRNMAFRGSVPANPGMGMMNGGPAIGNPGMGIMGGGANLAAIKLSLAVSDADWANLQEKVKRVLTLRGYLTRTMVVLPNAAAGENPLKAPMEELRVATQDPAAADTLLDEKVKAMRTARQGVQDDLTKAEKDLEDALTPRQRAVLVQLGVLD